ncbi:MAG: S9 family peptidase, partial [SAR202 cluster bacterium]|nr:S9 family peptidase [SAR202 cluster bacterium]
VCVREVHGGELEVMNQVVSVPLEGGTSGGEQGVLVTGSDFYSNPRISPDGRRLCWLSWDLPNMPWDGCELWVADVLPDGSLGGPTLVAGGKTEWVFQPDWSPGRASARAEPVEERRGQSVRGQADVAQAGRDSGLYFVAESANWANLYRWRDGRVEAMAEGEAEFATPQWVFGMRTYGFVPTGGGRIVCAYNQRGRWTLGSLDTESKRLTPYDLPFTEFSGVRVAPLPAHGEPACPERSRRIEGRADGSAAVFIAGSPRYPSAVVKLDVASGKFEVLRTAMGAIPDAAYLSEPLSVEFPTEGGRTAHAFYYHPKNRDYDGPRGQKPPLLVKVHGGPTGSASMSLDLRTQFWTSRGFAVLDVNYGGSTGYGREYRHRLNGTWGVLDVDDCVNGAEYLVRRGAVDGERMAIEGGSSGGYLTLCALTFRKVFKAGASYYGFGDIEALAKDFHKFESRYVDTLVGPYPQARTKYIERSPIYFTRGLNCPVIFFQGLEDTVVLPGQSEEMAAALREKGLPVAHLTFEGEGHGFRQASTIKRCLDAELYFFSKVFGFTPADTLEPVAIENL